MKLIPEYESDFSFTPTVISASEPNPARKLAEAMIDVLRRIPESRSVVFVCIGTDRSTGDSLGPLVGSRLRRYSFNDIHLYGTLDQPVHALNLADTVTQLHADYGDPYIIAIDACLGQNSSVGSVKLASGPVKPGAGVNKDLPPVGHMHITGIVNIGGFMEYFVLQNTRLSIVMNMAEVIAKGIYLSLLDCGRLAAFSSSSLYRTMEQ
ncbi:spore protease YyaC [Gorillibacterium massiliense]|uniref:spore protease YyaC n=1 Tax=Gorillibacterium massiliense TaxID=1280390 RepID=UPI0004B33557|nr:spore protease YyaC [Gorillibacterium massiliense]